MSIILLYYYLIINIISLFAMLLDKLAAIKGKNRFSEKSLLLISLLGGGIGGLAGMLLPRHKTRKFKFWFVNILAIALHTSLIITIYYLLK